MEWKRDSKRYDCYPAHHALLTQVLAFQTAVALAVYDANHKNKGVVPQPEDKHEGPGLIPKVMESHLRQVVSMSSAFRTYIKAAHQGKTDSDVAYAYGNRDDKTPSTPARPGL